MAKKLHIIIYVILTILLSSVAFAGTNYLAYRVITESCEGAHCQFQDGFECFEGNDGAGTSWDGNSNSYNDSGDWTWDATTLADWRDVDDSTGAGRPFTNTANGSYIIHFLNTAQDLNSCKISNPVGDWSLEYISVYGSNDNTTWTILGNNISTTGDGITTFNLTNTAPPVADTVNISDTKPDDNTFFNVLSLNFNATVNMTYAGNCTFFLNLTANHTINNISAGSVNANLSFNLSFSNSEEISYDYFFSCQDNTTQENSSSKTFTIFKPRIDDCSTYSNRTLNLTFLKESDGGLINSNVELFLEYKTEEGFKLNFSMNKSSVNMTYLCLSRANTSVVGDFWIEYDTAGYGNFSYFTFNTSLNSTLSTFLLYATSGVSDVTFTVLDTNDNTLPNILIHVLQFDVSTGIYTTTEIIKTDGEGKAIGNIVLGSEWYKFILYENATLLLETQPIIVTSTSKEFRVNLDEDYFDRYTDVRGVSHSLTFNNATNNFRFTWSDPAGIVHNACLKVVERTVYADTVLNDTCVVATSGTILTQVTQKNVTYIATSYLKFDELFILDVLTQVWGNLYEFWGEEGRFISFMLIAGMALIGFWNVGASVVLVGVTTLILNVIGFFYFGWEYLMLIFILGGILIYKTSK